MAENYYVGAKMGPTTYGYSNVINNAQLGWDIFGGYQFHQNFAVEIELASLGGFDTVSRKYTGSSFGVNGVGVLPLSDKFDLIGKLGIASTSIGATPQPGWILGGATSFSNTGLTLGFAGQYNVTQEFSLRAGVDIYPIGDSTINTTSASMIYIGGVLKF